MLVLVGPSAVGKTVVAQTLIKNHQMRKMVTYTTRPKRVSEIEGVDYFFLKNEQFQKYKEDGFFFETVCYNHNYYGTAISSLSDDKVVLIEPSGLDAYLDRACDMIWICYLECPLSLREERMKERGDSPEQIIKRIANDDLIFNDQVKKKCHSIINSYGLSVEEEAKLIFEMYYQAYWSKKNEQNTIQ